MIREMEISVGGAPESVFVFTVTPDWSRPPEVVHALKTDIVRSLTDRESRWPRWSCMRTELVYQYLAEGEAAAAFRTMLFAIGERRCVVPLWPDARERSDWENRYYDPQYIFEVETKSLHPVGDLGIVPPNHTVVPVILCRFERPSIRVLSEPVGEFQCRFVEASPWEWRCGVRNVTVDNGMWPLSVPAEWSRIEDLSKDRLEFIGVGESREPVLYGQEAPMRWGQEAGFELVGAQISDLLSFFANAARGRWHSFIVDQLFKPHEQATPGTPDGYVARLAEDKLTITFHTDSIASSRIRFWNVPWELNPPQGEVFEQPPTAHLYELRQEVFIGDPVYWHFTDNDQPVMATIDGAQRTFLPASVSHEAPSERLSSAPGTVTFRLGDMPDHPLAPWYRRQGEGVLYLSVYRVNTDNPNNPLSLFGGELGEVTLQRSVFRAEFGGRSRRQIPRAAMQRTDNHAPYAEGGGPPHIGYGVAGILSVDWGSKIFLNYTGGGGFGGTYFRGGWIRRGSGLSYESRYILHQINDPGEGADVAFDLERPFTNPQIGEGMVFYPGYDGTWSNAQWFTLYGGHHNFLGFPYLPVTNPSAENGAPNPQYPGKK